MCVLYVKMDFVRCWAQQFKNVTCFFVHKIVICDGREITNNGEIMRRARSDNLYANYFDCSYILCIWRRVPKEETRLGWGQAGAQLSTPNLSTHRSSRWWIDGELTLVCNVRNLLSAPKAFFSVHCVCMCVVFALPWVREHSDGFMIYGVL